MSDAPGPGHNMPPEETQEERLAAINPEALVVIDTALLPALFDLHYPDLKARGEAMLAACEKWKADHTKPGGGIIEIKDDDENAFVADFMTQVDDFVKEAEEARKKVKVAVYEAGQQIDGWFKLGLAAPVEDIRGVTRTVGGKRYTPGPGTMQFAQTQYLTAKAERERQAREAAAREAQREAQRKAEEARKLAEAEQQRIADLQAQGVAADEAREVVQAQTDQAAEAADIAQGQSALIGAFAAESDGALVRQHTATGTTVGLAGRWTFEVTSMPDLCLAVGAAAMLRDDFVRKVAAGAMVGEAGVRAVLQAAVQLLTHGGAIPPTFVATDDKVIRAAITARTSPLREAPGLRIYQEMSARRRGA